MVNIRARVCLFLFLLSSIFLIHLTSGLADETTRVNPIQIPQIKNLPSDSDPSPELRTHSYINPEILNTPSTVLEGNLVPPSVVEVFPKPNSQDVYPDSNLVIKLNQDMDVPKFKESVQICEGETLPCEKTILYDVSYFLGRPNEFLLIPHVQMGLKTAFDDETWYFIQMSGVQGPEGGKPNYSWFFKTNILPAKVREYFPKGQLTWNSLGASKYFQIYVSFNKQMDAKTFNFNNIKVFADSAPIVPGKYSSVVAGGNNAQNKPGMNSLDIRLDDALKPYIDKTVNFLVILKGGTKGIKDVDGNPLLNSSQEVDIPLMFTLTP